MIISLKRSAIVEEVENNAISGDAANTTSILVNATILYHEGNLETALKVLHAAPSDHLESMALRYYTELNQIPYYRFYICSSNCQKSYVHIQESKLFSDEFQFVN